MPVNFSQNPYGTGTCKAICRFYFSCIYGQAFQKFPVGRSKIPMFKIEVCDLGSIFELFGKVEEILLD